MLLDWSKQIESLLEVIAYTIIIYSKATSGSKRLLQNKFVYKNGQFTYLFPLICKRNYEK